MNTLIIYHSYPNDVPCPDGIAAAWVAKKKYPHAQLLGCVYGDIPKVDDMNQIIIVDFSFPKSVLLDWEVSYGIQCTIIDHHKTALDDLSGFESQLMGDPSIFIFDMEECGASLTWKTFFPDKPMPVFLKFIKDRDLWNFKYPETNAINSARGFIGKNFELLDLLEDCTEVEFLQILKPLGDKLLEPRRKAVENACTRWILRTVANYVCIPSVAVTKEEEYIISDICQQLYLQMPDAPFTACITQEGKWSLRSNKEGNNTDVGAIAKSMSGGGHRNAAGYSETYAKEGI